MLTSHWFWAALSLFFITLGCSGKLTKEIRDLRNQGSTGEVESASGDASARAGASDSANIGTTGEPSTPESACASSLALADAPTYETKSRPFATFKCASWANHPLGEASAKSGPLPKMGYRQMQMIVPQLLARHRANAYLEQKILKAMIKGETRGP